MRRTLQALAAVSVLAGCTSALAQDGREAQVVGFHDLCDHGDKKACVKLGMMLQQNTDRQAEWRRSHPEWFFFER